MFSNVKWHHKHVLNMYLHITLMNKRNQKPRIQGVNIGQGIENTSVYIINYLYLESIITLINANDLLTID